MAYTREELHEPVGEFWLCAGECGQWKKGIAAAHNGSGYVCSDCERKSPPPEAASEPSEL